MPASPARRTALTVLRRVEEQGAYADRALHGDARDLDARDRALAKRLVFGTVQRRGTLDWIIAQHVDRRLDPQAWAPRLARTGGGFVQHLHGHHGIEDDHYFPILVTRDARLERGFEILDTDHHALDGYLGRFTDEANAALRALKDRDRLRTEAGRLHEGLLRLDRFIDRHLTDEEELIVPVILLDGEAGLR